MDALPGPDGRHLTGVDLELLLRGNQEGDEYWQLARHLRQCQDCQLLMERYQGESRAFELLKTSTPGTHQPDCPAREVWINLAAGTLEDSTADRLLDHAVSCSHCGSRLREAMEDLHSDDIPPIANAVLTADFREQVIAKLDQKPRAATMLSRRPWLAPGSAAAAAVVLASAGIWYLVGTEPDAERLIAQSYSSRRTMELRIPGAAYAQLTATKGSGGGAGVSGNEYSARAAVQIQRGLSAERTSPRWLQLRSRLELIDWNYDSAIHTLQQLAAADPGNHSIQADLGNSYLLRGMHLDNARDLLRAVETLSGLLRPGVAEESSELFRVALFNRALANERLHFWEQAAADWSRYLKIDSASGWSEEARSRLAQIEKDKRAWRNELRKQQLLPAGFLAALRKDPGLPLEPYLELAVRQWIPSLGAASPLPEAPAALRRLADLTAERHRDRWLSDLLLGVRQPEFAAAAAMLAGAVEANDTGRRDEGLALSSQAARRFAGAGNLAGSLRARLERVYSLSRGMHDAECSREGRELVQPLLDREYAWAYGRLLLERSTCAVRAGLFGDAQALRQEAVERIGSAGYPTLLLRAIGFAANLQMVLGRYDDASRLDHEGLKLFWQQGFHPPYRAYQFYDNLSQAAERQKQWELGFLAESEALPMIELEGKPGAAAVARYRLAMFAGKTRRAAEARSEIERAGEDFGKISGESSTLALRAEGQLMLASSLLESGELALARQVLEKVRTGDFKNNRIQRAALHRVKGMVAVRLQRGRQEEFDEGRRELTAALDLAQAALPGLRTERDRAHWKREAGTVYRELIRLAVDHDGDPELGLALWESFRSAPVQGGEARQQRPEMREVSSSAVPAMRALAAGYQNASVLAFAQIDEALQGWFYDNRGIYPFRSPAKVSELAPMCAALSRMAAQPASPAAEIDALSHRVYAALIKPVEHQLDPQRLLLIEPDGPCSAIPFELLRDGRGVYLTDKFAIATSPGAWAERALRSRSQPVTTATHALVVENPRLGAGVIRFYPPLPNARREADLVRAAFASHTSLAGSAAALDAVLRELPRAGVFYFGGHGDSHGGNGGLLLAPRAAASGGDVELLDGTSLEPALGRCRLAILSACSTAAGERMGPFNPASLIQALWRSGVPAVVATRWEVDERATAALLESLMRHLLSGAAPPVALRAAMSEVRRIKGLEHPMHWAAFHVFGVSQPEPGERGV